MGSYVFCHLSPIILIVVFLFLFLKWTNVVFAPESAHIQFLC